MNDMLELGDNLPLPSPTASQQMPRQREMELDPMRPDAPARLINLATDRPVWDRVFSVAPLVIVGSKEESGLFNLAPKHLAMPLGWENFYCFVCSPQHTTYHNIRRNGEFTISYPRPSDVLLASLAAAPRCEDQSKPSLPVLPTIPAREVDGVLVEGSYLFLECTLHSILDGFGPNSLIIGNVVAASAHEDALRDQERDEADQIFALPLLAYISPGRLAEIRQTTAFPFPIGFSR
jgi:flavin reductase (DIM6/NTAB) family NADH-FMN oxidoreductase RutF